MRHFHSRESHAFGGIMVGLLAGVALGLLFSPASGKENRRRFSNWMRRMEEDLADRMSRMRDMTQEKYNHIVDELSRKYRKLSGIKGREYDDFVNDLRNRWGRIKDQWHEMENNNPGNDDSEDVYYSDDDRWR